MFERYEAQKAFPTGHQSLTSESETGWLSSTEGGGGGTDRRGGGARHSAGWLTHFPVKKLPDTAKSKAILPHDRVDSI